MNRCLGVIRTNGISVTASSGAKCRCLYPKVSILSHSCVANARCIRCNLYLYRPAHTQVTLISCSLKDHRIRIVAQRRIPAGEEIFISYTSMVLPTRRRRLILKRNWCFDCDCSRCRDPTELGSNQGSLICYKCSQTCVAFKIDKGVSTT